ncbi:pentapeptide repeat-containing protein [Actinomadura violacea]|uniref:Pentapeptide repeat-containing protein n=1 Tax=Actinomadura violacea TaxID=2819934 RepID=A0ABS3RU21_9ACTN|nr:pentapeptide repeat-containing protein [Actinomadura violacea]MBO2459803.1 pentapeptide repeat-containing protein [Actinomadura violacea]
MSRPTAAEISELSTKDRLDLLEQRRQAKHQAMNTFVITLGVLFTIAGLTTTYLTLRATQEGQITDRYTKAVEQLGSKDRDVRIGGLYALERIAADSSRDYSTIMDVLAAYVREHDPMTRTKSPTEPDTDVQTALSILIRHPRSRQATPLDLHGIRVRGAKLGAGDLASANLKESDLANVDLSHARLNGADLSDAHFAGGTSLGGADLSDATLENTDLTQADLEFAKLRGANLAGATLNGAPHTDFTGAYLRDAHLGGADLGHANLSDAALMDADLNRADLTGVNLNGADLSGADLRNVKGMDTATIRRIAHVDSKTTL